MKKNEILRVDTTDLVAEPTYANADIVPVPCDEEESQRIKLLNMANNPLERCLLEQFGRFHREVEVNLNRAVEAGGAAQELYYNRAAKFSRGSLRLAEAVLKQHGRGEQRMVVEYQTSSASRPHRHREQIDARRKPMERRNRSARATVP